MGFELRYFSVSNRMQYAFFAVSPISKLRSPIVKRGNCADTASFESLVKWCI